MNVWEDRNRAIKATLATLGTMMVFGVFYLLGVEIFAKVVLTLLGLFMVCLVWYLFYSVVFTNRNGKEDSTGTVYRRPTEGYQPKNNG